MVCITNLISSVALATLVLAHPGEDHAAEAQKRAAQLQQASKRSLAHCAEKLKARGHVDRAVARRSVWAENLRKRQFLESRPFLKARDLTALNTSHASNLTGLTANATDSELFADNEGGCVLQPEVTEGPYYVSGELVRTNIVEDQEGVPLYADVQFLDIETCEPIPNVYVDWWHCNSTGVYSGVSASGNGDSATDTSNLDATFLRGIQQSDTDGVIRVETLVPGHYTGRTNHVHILAHQTNATVNANGTITSTNAMHVGQLFFDQDLLETVEAEAPYSTNTQDWTQNADDSILLQEADSSDPMMEYVLLGDSISDGLLAWIQVGINTSYAYEASAAATLTSSGGVANANSGMGGGPGGNGTGPSGTGVPSGTPPATIKFF